MKLKIYHLAIIFCKSGGCKYTWATCAARVASACAAACADWAAWVICAACACFAATMAWENYF